MKTRLPKVFLLFCTIAILHLAEACWMNGGDCNCDDVLLHFDYQNVTAQISDPSKGNILEISMLPADIEFLAGTGVQERGFGLNTAALACDCIPEGGRGDKFPFQRLTITAEEDWNDVLTAGKPLNALFRERAGDAVGQTISEVSVNGFGLATRPLVLDCETQPQNLSQEMHFTATIVKSNGVTIVVKFPGVKFQ